MSRIEEVVVAKTVISAKISQAYMDKVDAYLAARPENEKLTRSQAVVAALDLFMAGGPAPAPSPCETCGKDEALENMRNLIAELEAKVAKLKAPKKPAKPRILTKDSAACWRVLQAIALLPDQEGTNVEVAELMDRQTNYVAARFAELLSNGYIEDTGKRLESPRSKKKLPVMKLTMKPLPT